MGLIQVEKAGTRCARFSSTLHYVRSDLKPARTSSEKTFGYSQAAKRPPLSSLL